NVEEQRIEAVDVIQAAQPTAVGFSLRRIACLEIGLHVPAFPRDLADAVLALGDVLPVFLECACLGKLTGHAYDGYGLYGPGGGLTRGGLDGLLLSPGNELP